MHSLILMPGYLALKEVWRNRGRFLLVSMVIALITLLVLFIAALGEGLGSGNREYLSKLDADLLVFQSKSDLLIPASRLGRDRLAAVRRVVGVADAGELGISDAKLLVPGKTDRLTIAILGVDPGHVGEPPVLKGRGLSASLALEAIIDRNTALRSNLKVGDSAQLQVTQGTKDQIYILTVVGISDSRQYGLRPSIFVPFLTWDRIRPKSEAEVDFSNPVPNVMLVKLTDPAQADVVGKRIEAQINKVETSPIPAVIQALPGYSAQQSTLNTQAGFTFFIGVLVIGGFFQIQILQKVPQIGVLKAIGASNLVVASASVIQIMIVTAVGVAIGGLLTFLFSLTFPPTIPIVFNGVNSAVSIVALLLIGPVGGMVSIRYAVRIEPLKALGLSS